MLRLIDGAPPRRRPRRSRRRHRLALLSLAPAFVLLPLAAGPWTATDPTAGAHLPLVLGLLGLAAPADARGDVRALIEGVERVAAGEYDVSFDLDREDELGELADALEDMTGEVRRREAVHERHAEYTQTVLDAIDDVFYVLDREGGHERWNRALVEASGYDPDEVARMHPLEYFEGEDRERIADAMDEAFETGEVRVQADLRTAEGESIPYEWSAARLRAPDGRPVVAGVGRDVTERVERERQPERRQRELERHKRYTDGVLDSMEDVFYVVGPDGSFRRWNRSLADATGYDDEEIADMAPVEFVVEADRPTIAEAVQEVFETGSARAEARVLTKSGESIPYEFVGTLLEDPDGDEVLVGVGRDVTERVERERKLEALVENTTNPIYIKDRDGRYLFANEAAGEYFGLDPGEVVGATDAELFDSASVPEVRADDEQVLETGRAVTQEVTRSIDGREHVFLDNKYPFRDEDGRVVGVMGISRDITARKRRERELRRTNARLEAVIEASPDALVAIDPEGTVELWNPAAERIFGWTAEEAAGDRLPFVPAADEAEFESLRRRVLDGETLSGVETKRSTADGELVDVSLSAAPLRDSDGDVVGVMGALEDITERKAYERELEARSAAIEEAIDGIAILDSDHRYTFVNRAHAEVYGYDDPAAFLGATWRLCYGEEETARIEAECLPELRETGSWRGEATGLRADGTTFPQELSLTTLEDGRTICVVRDVSERKAHERELERSNWLLEQAQQLARVGAWELDLESEPPAFQATDEFYRIHEVSSKSAFDREMALSFYHPADRGRVRRVMDAAAESGREYDVEVRLTTAGDRTRWVRAIGQPVRRDGEVVALRGSIQDVTDRKEQELTLESLHEVSRSLLEAESRDAVAELVVDAAVSVLDLPCVAAYLLDDESGRLEPEAVSERFARACADGPTAHAAGADSALWDAYVSGTVRTLDGTAIADSHLSEEAVNGGLLVPVGDHGVLVAASPRERVSEDDRRVAETLVATMETALYRLDSEADLRAREAELAERNRRLRRQMQITAIIRRVDQSLVGAGTREAVESAVCERLVESEDVAFAWIGTLDTDGEALVPRAWAGTGQEYLDAVELGTAGEAPEPAVRTAVSGSATVVGSVVDAVTDERWRKHALVREFSSVLAVPLEYDDLRYGVLAVYGTDPGTFGDLERTVFEELGEGIANSINALEARHALYADAFVELRLRFDAPEDFLGQVAAETGARVEYVGMATHAEDESRLFFETRGVDPEAVAEVLGDLHAVSEHRLISEADEPDLFEATVAGEVLAGRLVGRGGVPRSMVADGDGLEVVVDVPPTTDVREFVELLRERHPSAELVGRRDVHRDVQTRQELVSDLFEALTDRQLEVLRTAYLAGYFEWPRESTGEEIAELLEVSQPTVNRHLRHGLGRLIGQLFEDEPSALAEP